MAIRQPHDEEPNEAETRPPRASARLRNYRAKRDFSATPEPAPAPDSAGERDAPRFVIHEHHARRLHWDLRLERDGVLASWAIPKGLPEAPGENRFAAATEDHPLEYLDFARARSPPGQYGAGTDRDLGPRHLRVPEVGAAQGRGRAARRARGRALRAVPDRQGDAAEGLDDPSHGPARRIREREPMPRRIVPMLARAGALPADDGRWAFEIKWDGVRAIAYSSPASCAWRAATSTTSPTSYPELARLDRALGSHSAVLDGEIVAFDRDGRPSFSALQQRMQLTTREQARRQMKNRPSPT